MSRSLRRTVLAVLALVVLGACSDRGGDDGAEPVVEEVAPSTSPREVRRPIIHLVVTDWTGARVNVAIAERLIERRLGYPVEAVEMADVGAMLDGLETGSLDAVLELWPSSLEQVDRDHLEAGVVEELGPLGVEGRIGWWVPRYVAEGDLAVTGWEALADPEVARAFATPGTGSRGRFLGTDPSYEQYDEELIDSLGLPFEVEYSGSEEATAREVAAAVEAERPILLYWWTPSALVARHDLVRVPLPERTPECVGDFRAGAPAACDYPVDELVKLGSPDLATRAPEVHRFLTAFRLTTDDQLGLIDAVENRGEPVERAAERWIATNPTRWEAWLTDP